MQRCIHETRDFSQPFCLNETRQSRMYLLSREEPNSWGTGILLPCLLCIASCFPFEAQRESEKGPCAPQLMCPAEKWYPICHTAHECIKCQSPIPSLPSWVRVFIFYKPVHGSVINHPVCIWKWLWISTKLEVISRVPFLTTSLQKLWKFSEIAAHLLKVYFIISIFFFEQ